MVWTFTKAGNMKIIISHELGGCSFIIVENSSDTANRAVVYSSELFADNSDFEECLYKQMQQHNAYKASCSVVMRHGTYSHLVIDKPMVPAKEMADAVQWVTKDLIKDLPYQAPLLSHFYGSELAAGREQNKLHIVVVEQATATYYQQLILQQGLQLGVMTIEELAVVNMLHKSASDCILVYLSLSAAKSNNAIFMLNDKLLGIKRLPAVAAPQENFAELWQSLQHQLEYYSQNTKKDYSFKFILAPYHSSGYDEQMLQESFAAALNTNATVFDVKNDFYAGPMVDEICQQNKLLLLGAC